MFLLTSYLLLPSFAKFPKQIPTTEVDKILGLEVADVQRKFLDAFSSDKKRSFCTVMGAKRWGGGELD